MGHRETKVTQSIIRLVGNSLEIKPNFFIYIFQSSYQHSTLTFHYLQNISVCGMCVGGYVRVVYNLFNLHNNTEK